jgi:hypothetical protein
MRRLILPLMLAALAVPAVAAEPVLTPHGYGWLKIPATSTDDAIAGAPTPPQLAVASDDPSTCAEYSIGDSGMVFMTQEMWVARVSVYKPGFATAEGVQVGDTSAKVRKVYGKKVIKEHAPYGEPPAEDLYVWETPDYGYRFEIDDKGVVTTIHAGSDAIRYMEGCL